MLLNAERFGGSILTLAACRHILIAEFQISALFAFPVFSFLAWSSLGWHSVHYGACIATALFFGLFMLINYDDEFKEKAARESTFNASFYILKTIF